MAPHHDGLGFKITSAFHLLLFSGLLSPAGSEWLTWCDTCSSRTGGSKSSHLSSWKTNNTLSAASIMGRGCSLSASCNKSFPRRLSSQPCSSTWHGDFDNLLTHSVASHQGLNAFLALVSRGTEQLFLATDSWGCGCGSTRGFCSEVRG